jgi:hypothetical protein
LMICILRFSLGFEGGWFFMSFLFLSS